MRRPVEQQLYWRKPLPHDLTPTQAEVIRQLDRHETPLTRADLRRLGVGGDCAVKNAVFALIDRRLVEMGTGGRMAFRLLPAELATLDD